MALKNSKITREILLNNYKYLSNRTDIYAPLSSNKGIEIIDNETEIEGSPDSTPCRYILSNTRRPSVLPEIVFPKEPEELIPPEMRYLQPSMLPKFMELREVKNTVEWEPVATKELECPFPEPIRELRTKTITISDLKKAELKSPSINVNFKNNNLSVINRNYSTSPFFIVSRSFANKKPKAEEKCEETKRKCPKKGGCQSFIMKECPLGKPKSDCTRVYEGVKCSKKTAPYPSYSESCAERLDDDPSECLQCPWQKCGGVESIKPPKRDYHTSITTARSLTLVPGYPVNDVNYMPFKDCVAKKEPCKRPPGKCDKKEEKKKEKCPEPEPKKKKCMNWSSAYDLWNAKENILDSYSWQDLDAPKNKVLEFGDCDKKYDMKLSKDTKTEDKTKDKSHPPPCPSNKKPSRQCPKEVKKPPYRQESDLNTAYYKKSEDKS
ncbi:hypothetical protein JTB14_000709 [Gonioctena quinquepunctata]|nr:hypothetical protein JTB14_000709 [Gonioctena quinquepunctata]